VLGFLAKLLVNERVIRHLLTATVGVADDVRRRSRDVESARGKAGGDIAVRVDALEASLLKQAGMTSMIAAQLEGVATALQVVTFRLAIALALGGLALLLALVALLVAILR
jgi:hypothetical protein